MLQELQVGDEVITIGGIIGRIVEERVDRLLLTSGDDTKLWVAKHAISGRLETNIPLGPGQTEEGDEEDAA
jgi:preprotein translocase subunit YajC